MGVEEQTIMLIIGSCIIVGWACKDAWDRPNWIAGRGTVITLAGSLIVLLLLSFTS